MIKKCQSVKTVKTFMKSIFDSINFLKIFFYKSRMMSS